MVSNNSAAAVEACLERHGLSPFVAAVAGRAGPDPARLKPSPEPVLRAMRALGAEPAESLMVGDSPFDIAAARAAGVPAVGYVCRPGLRERLLAAGAMATVETLAELGL